MNVRPTAPVQSFQSKTPIFDGKILTWPLVRSSPRILGTHASNTSPSLELLLLESGWLIFASLEARPHPNESRPIRRQGSILHRQMQFESDARARDQTGAQCHIAATTESCVGLFKRSTFNVQHSRKTRHADHTCENIG